MKHHSTGLKVRCPTCGDVSNVFTEAARENEDERGPEPGDMLICVECNGLNILTEALTARAVTAEERATPEFQADWPEIDQLLRESEPEIKQLRSGKKMS